jgi:hypothetical protein
MHRKVREVVEQRERARNARARIREAERDRRGLEEPLPTRGERM